MGIGAVPKLSSGGATLPIAESDVTGLVADLAAKAPLASPTFTGTVTLPSGLILPASVVIPSSAVATTQSADDSSTKVATTAYADAIKALKANIASPTFTGTPTAPSYTASGLTGATAASRYAGATTSGPPTSGTFVTGDWIVDQSGAMYLCTAGGSPGTWTMVSPPVYNSSFLGETGNMEDLVTAATAVLVSGRIYDSKLVVRKSAASGTRTIWYYLNTAGATLTAGQNLIAVYDAAGTKLGSTSADQTTNFAGSAGPFSVTVGTFAINAGDILHIELLAVGTTPPKMGGLTANQTTGVNSGLSGGNLRGSVQASGQTAMPASITPGSLSTTNAQMMWFGIT